MSSRVLMIVAGLASFALLGCATRRTVETNVETAPVTTVQVIEPPGVVEYVWEEPIVDVIDVPPGLDPEGHYYRPAHQEVVQIRQGRWVYHRKPEDKVE